MTFADDLVNAVVDVTSRVGVGGLDRELVLQMYAVAVSFTVNQTVTATQADGTAVVLTKYSKVRAFIGDSIARKHGVQYDAVPADDDAAGDPADDDEDSAAYEATSETHKL
eukprot:5672174-Pyramimonas_sp.AAC.1